VTCVALILRTWLALPVWYQDTGLTLDQRADLYRPVAVAVCAVARTDTERAFLARQTYGETRLARYVLEDRCKDGPPGARCDAGLATGPWQAHRVSPYSRNQHCNEAWTAPTLAERYAAGARCALQLAKSCRNPEGWFAAQSGRGQCHAEWARRRLKLFWWMLEKVRDR
jgi:hypothetical protein